MKNKKQPKIIILLLVLTAIIFIWPSIRFNILPYRAQKYSNESTEQVIYTLKKSHTIIQNCRIYEAYGRLYLDISVITKNPQNIEKLISDAQNLLSSDEFVSKYFEDDTHRRMQKKFVLKIYYNYKSIISNTYASYFEKGWTIDELNAFNHVDRYKTWTAVPENYY